MVHVIENIRKYTQLPHITRKISASFLSYAVKVGLWSLLAILILSNLYAKVNLTPVYWDKLVRVLEIPYIAESHIDLAQTLWQQGVSTPAKHELQFATSLITPAGTETSQVLGASVNPTRLLRDWQNRPSKLTNDLAFWQQVVSEKPDYRDAYIMLASLSYQLTRFTEANTFIEEAIRLDPNYSVALKLKREISSQTNGR